MCGYQNNLLLADWQKNENGNYVCFEGGCLSTVFQMPNGEWKAAEEGYFSQGGYETADEAMMAVEKSEVKWVLPSDNSGWKQTKDKTGWYRRPRNFGTISVKQAKTGKWFWVMQGNGSPKGWYNTASDAMADADAYLQNLGEHYE